MLQKALYQFNSLISYDILYDMPRKSSGDDELKVVKKKYQLLDGSIDELVERVGDGSIIKRFDKTPVPSRPTDVVCPHFLELKWATGCPYDCAWCYLQGTFRFLPYGKKPRNKGFERVEKHLLSLFNGDGVKPELLNSGELSDSFITERSEEPFTIFIMDRMATQDKHKVLFVTKSDYVNNLLKVPNAEQAVVSFSINAEKVADRWERAPKVSDRIEAAGKLADAGFVVRLRIDPMVPVEGWKEEYSRLVDMVFCKLTPERITIGSLRGLQSTINNAKDRSWVRYLDECSNWGKKIRFDLRKEMYEFVINKLKEDHGFENVALCKETVEMWRTLGMDYREIKCNCIQ